VSKWKLCKIGDLCDTISDTYKRTDDMVILINTSDVLEGEVLNHETVPNKNLKGQFKKTFKKNDIVCAKMR
jgi:type I restriction enzyme S subunit